MSSKGVKGLVECPVCGQRMKRITPTHLKKHNMTPDLFRAKYGDIAATDQSQMVDLSEPGTLRNLTDQVVNYIAQDAQIGDIGRQVIQKLMDDQDGKFRVALNIAAVNQISTLNNLFDSLSTIRTLLLDKRRMAAMDDKTAIKVTQMIERSVERVLNNLKDLSIGRNKGLNGLFEQTNIVNIFDRDPTVPDTPTSPAGRERIRTVITGITQAALNAERQRATERIVDAEIVAHPNHVPPPPAPVPEIPRKEEGSADSNGVPGVAPPGGELSPSEPQSQQ